MKQGVQGVLLATLAFGASYYFVRKWFKEKPKEKEAVFIENKEEIIKKETKQSFLSNNKEDKVEELSEKDREIYNWIKNSLSSKQDLKIQTALKILTSNYVTFEIHQKLLRKEGILDLLLMVMNETSEKIAENCAFCISTIICSKYNWKWVQENDLLSILFDLFEKYEENVSIATSFIYSSQIMSFSDEEVSNFEYIEKIGIVDKIVELIEKIDEKKEKEPKHLTNIENSFKVINNIIVGTHFKIAKTTKVLQICKKHSHLEIAQRIISKFA